MDRWRPIADEEDEGPPVTIMAIDITAMEAPSAEPGVMIGGGC